jgi:hypothetical protein
MATNTITFSSDGNNITVSSDQGPTGATGAAGATGATGAQGPQGDPAPTIHSGLTLDDGTNPHGTTKTDVGLSNVDNLQQLPLSGGTMSGDIDMDGSHILTPQRLINTASPTAILSTDGTILFDSVAATTSINLPAASVGKIKIPFKDAGANSSVNNITINRVGSDTIVDSATGQTSTIISSNGFSGYFLSNGVDTWYLL